MSKNKATKNLDLRISRYGLISSWCAVGVAALMLIVSAYNNYLDRQTAKINVEPYLQFGHEIHQNAPGAVWFIINSGLGPAIVKKFSYFVDGEETRNFMTVIEKLNKSKNILISGQVIPDNARLHPGKHTLFTFGPEGGLKTVPSWMKRVVIKICYCSIYDDCWLADNRGNNKVVSDCSLPLKEKWGA